MAGSGWAQLASSAKDLAAVAKTKAVGAGKVVVSLLGSAVQCCCTHCCVLVCSLLQRAQASSSCCSDQHRHCALVDARASVAGLLPTDSARRDASHLPVRLLPLIIRARRCGS